MFKELIIRDKLIKVNKSGTIIYREGKLANIYNNSDGYPVVSINNRAISVHRIVALAFVYNPNPKEKIEVNHIDFDRTNSHYTNLEWVTHAENIAHSAKNGRYVGKFGKDNPNYGNTKLSEFYKENPEIALQKQSRKGIQNGMSKPIELYKDGVLVKKFEYIGDCCKYLHINHGFSDNAEIVRVGIRRSIKKNVPYKGFTFVK